MAWLALLGACLVTFTGVGEWLGFSPVLRVGLVLVSVAILAAVALWRAGQRMLAALPTGGATVVFGVALGANGLDASLSIGAGAFALLLAVARVAQFAAHTVWELSQPDEQSAGGQDAVNGESPRVG